MNRHIPRSGSPAPSRTIAPFHRGPQAMTPVPQAAAAAMHPPANPPAHAPNAALLIDFDNVTMGIRSDLQMELKNLLSSAIIKGKVAVRRAYADWRRYPQYIVPLTESSIDLIFAPAYGSAKKNATDIRLAIDALELVFTRPEIGTFVLLSGDSDFSSMVIKLKEYGKYVIGVGIRESSSDLLVMNCDEYYSYNALAGLVKTGEDETTRWDPWELVKESVARMKRNGDVMRSDRLKQVMQEIDSSFDEKNLGMPKFSRFVQEASHRGLLTVTKLDSGQLEVDVPAGGTAVSPTTEGGIAAAPTSEADARREATEREDRRGRRGRRGRGRDRVRPDRGEDESEGEPVAVEAADNDTPAEQTATSAATVPSQEAGAPADTTPMAAAPEVGMPAREPREGQRDRGRRDERTPRTPSDSGRSASPSRTENGATPSTPASPAFGVEVADHIGTSGERLTRSEAFDLVRRSVESLVSGDDSTSASAARLRAFELLGRNSESLSLRNFERVLQDAHDADMIDLRRRGHDFELARAAQATSIVEQLKLVDDAQQAADKAKKASLPPVPRGMGARGIGGRSKGSSSGALPPGLFSVGVVGGRPAPINVVKEPTPESTNAGSVAEAPKASEPKVEAKEAPKAESVAAADQVASKATAKPAKAAKGAKKSSRKAAAAKEAPAKAPVSQSAGSGVSGAKTAVGGASSGAKRPAKKAAKKVAAKKAPAKKAPAKKTAAKKAAKPSKG